MDLLARITHTSGGATVRDTGISVGQLLVLLASGARESKVLESHPSLELDDISAAKAFLVSALRSATHAARDIGVSRRQLIDLLNSPHLSIPRPTFSQPTG